MSPNDRLLWYIIAINNLVVRVYIVKVQRARR